MVQNYNLGLRYQTKLLGLTNNPSINVANIGVANLDSMNNHRPSDARMTNIIPSLVDAPLPSTPSDKTPEHRKNPPRMTTTFWESRGSWTTPTPPHAREGGTPGEFLSRYPQQSAKQRVNPIRITIPPPNDIYPHWPGAPEQGYEHTGNHPWGGSNQWRRMTTTFWLDVALKIGRASCRERV